MLLRLVLPYIDKRIQGGTIIKWHKNEGEWVRHGDDLFEIQVEKIRVLSRPTLPEQIIQRLDHRGTTPRRANAFLCITSSDMGIIRRIYAKEGTQCEVGDSLVLLSTDEKELFDETSQAVQEAGLFRVVVNFL